MRWTAKWAVRLLIATALLATILGGTLATHTGQSALLALISWLASDEEHAITFGAIEGSLLSKGKIGKIGLADRDGEWLTVRDVSFDWRPAKLLLGRLHVRRIDVAGVDVLRTPHQGSSPSGSTSPPHLIPASIDHIEISQIAIDKSVFRAPARFKIIAAAHFDDLDHAADARFEVERLDQPGSTLTAALNYRTDTNQLSLAVRGQEPPDGLVAQIAGLPSTLPLSVNVHGDGPLDQWRGTVALKASDTPFVAGAISIDRVTAGYGFSARLDGYLEAIAPQHWRAILSGKTVAQVSGDRTDDGRVVIDELALSNDALRFTGAGNYHPKHGELTGKAHLSVAREDGLPISLPIASDTPSSIASLDVIFDLPDVEAAKPATLALSARSIAAAAGTADQLIANGELKRSSNRLHDGPFKFTASLLGLKHTTSQIAEAIGDNAELSAIGELSGPGTLDLQKLTFRLATGSVEGHGKLDNGKFNGQAEARAANLKPFLQLAGIDATGSAEIHAQGVIAFDAAAFDATVSGASPSITLTATKGSAREFGVASFAFKASRDRGGPFNLHDAEIKSKALNATGQLTIADAKLDGDARADFTDLALMLGDTQGQATLSAKIGGTFEELHSLFVVEGRSITIAGRKLTDVVARLDGSGPIDRHAVQANIDAVVTGQRLEARSKLRLAPDVLAVDSLELDWGALAVTGNATLSPQTTQGRFAVKHTNLSQLKALAGLELTGSMKADIDIVATESGPAARVELVSGGANIAGAKFGKIDVTATVPLHDPLRFTTATARADAVVFEKTEIGDVRLKIGPVQDGLRAEISAKAPDSDITLAGRMKSLDDAMIVSLEDFRLRRHGKAMQLSRHATIRLDKSAVTVSGLSLQSNDGHVEVEGVLSADALHIDTRIDGMPAELIDMADASIGSRGRLSGSIRAKGSLSRPTVDFEAVWRGASAHATRQIGLPPIELRTQGQLADAIVSARFDATGSEGLSIASQVRLSGKGFNALSATINARAPLPLANAMLAERGTRLTGAALMNAKLGGTLNKPTLDGDIRIENASARDSGSGTALEQINGTARISESALEIVDIHGIGDKGGAVSVRGALSWSSNPPELKDLTIRLDRLKIDDKKQISGEVDGSLTIAGPVDNLIAAGRIDLKRLDVLVPEQLPRSVAALDLKHVNAPAQIAQTADPANGARSQGRTSTAGLRIVIHALDRISVRGRGLDALLGGELKLRGTVDAPVADGAFQLVRGRLALLGRQLDFQRGSVAFAGTLEPYLDLEAGAEADGVDITVTVSGPASQPEFKFSSQPDLPDDEILARLVFNKALIKLTPMQIAQLASEIDKIGGLSSGPGVLDQLKSTIGIDRLDLTTEKNGSTAVSAGSYVSDDTYVGVRQGLSAGSSRVVIDHDLTKNLKARGEIGADGNSKLGIGVEWDY